MKVQAFRGAKGPMDGAVKVLVFQAEHPWDLDMLNTLLLPWEDGGTVSITISRDAKRTITHGYGDLDTSVLIDGDGPTPPSRSPIVNSAGRALGSRLWRFVLEMNPVWGGAAASGALIASAIENDAHHGIGAVAYGSFFCFVVFGEVCRAWKDSK